MKGLFITFEGPDGAGKTTQIQSLANTLRLQGHDVVVTREPGGTAISNKIRALLLSTEHEEMVDQAEVLLYAASRAQHVHEIIVPALQHNKIVLCDRYIDASIAYQAYGLGIDEAIIYKVNEFASSGIKPTRTYMLDITVEESRRRLQQRAMNSDGAIGLDRIEQKTISYHQRVREGFLNIAQNDPDRVLLIDANRAVEKISHDIIEDCQRLIKQIEERE